MVRRLLRPFRALVGVRRVFFVAVLALTVTITLMLAVLVVGLFVNDRGIADERREARAKVLSVSLLRTDIEFVNDLGQSVRPPGGVLYPGKLHPGQQVLVEYRASDPKVVRVAGRNMSVAWPGIAMSVAGLYLVAVPVLILLAKPRRGKGKRRSARRRLRGRQSADALG